MEFVRNFTLWKSFLNENGYKLCKSIGHGGFGDVFSIIAKHDSNEYAIKRLISRRNIMADQSAMGEIKALLELDHPCIIRLKEVLLCDRMACLVMELATGGNLEDLIKRSYLTDAFTFKAFRQTICGIEYCHSCGIAHRDINPSNILIFDTGQVKIADFGLCFQCKERDDDKERLCSDYLGQEAYLAPEVKNRAPYKALLADIWSLGCVLLFVLFKDPSYGDINLNAANTTQSIPNMENDGINVSCDSHPKSMTFKNSLGFVYLATHLKSINPSKRPTASDVLKKWTNLGADFQK